MQWFGPQVGSLPLVCSLSPVTYLKHLPHFSVSVSVSVSVSHFFKGSTYVVILYSAYSIFLDLAKQNKKHDKKDTVDYLKQQVGCISFGD